jgi:hypothetical protein
LKEEDDMKWWSNLKYIGSLKGGISYFSVYIDEDSSIVSLQDHEASELQLEESVLTDEPVYALQAELQFQLHTLTTAYHSNQGASNE